MDASGTRHQSVAQDSAHDRDSRRSAYWTGYPLTVEPREIERRLERGSFVSAGQRHELQFFEYDRSGPSIVVSPGSGGHGLVFAELGFLMHLAGYNVFLMPKHGDLPIDALVQRHADALAHIAAQFNDRVGIYAEGLGGYATFYLALAQAGSQAPLRSLVLQNSPALLTEEKFHRAITGGDSAGRRRARLLPWVRRLAKVFPAAKVPISWYLDFEELVDPKGESHAIEAALIARYRKDPGFDRSYSLSTILSLVSTPAPAPLMALTTPTMFLVPTRGITPAYFRDLFVRLPPIPKALLEVDGSVFWMVSHPRMAAGLIASWFDKTL